MKKAKQFSYDELLAVLDRYDPQGTLDSPGRVPAGTELRDELTKVVDSGFSGNQAVLGIDIFRYSRMDPLPQSIVPFVLQLLYWETIKHCQEGCPFLFRNTSAEELRDHFIDTGDGGYQLLDTPLHALYFAVEFEFALRMFNSYTLRPQLRRLFTTDLIARYAITYQPVFRFQDNYYGPGIISNCRIIGRDQLNRCLIDHGTFDWFTVNTRGVENLATTGLKDLALLPDFSGYDPALAASSDAAFAVKGAPQLGPWKDIDVLKIGEIRVKDGSFTIYNLHVHYVGGYTDEKDPNNTRWFTVTLGNLNTSGIAD